MCNCICDPIIKCIYYLFNINNNKCKICDKNLSSRLELSTHIKNKHSEIFVWGSSKNFMHTFEKEKLIK